MKTEAEKVGYAISRDADEQSNEVADTAPSTLDKEACYAAAKILKEAWSIFDVTPTQAVWYSTTRPMAGSSIQDVLLPQICSGTQRFDTASETKFELVAITSESTTKILLGEYWISDGAILSPLTESQYSRLANMLVGRERQGSGPGANMSRTRFDKQMEEQAFIRMAAAQETQKQREKDLRRAQQGLPTDCIE